MVSTKSQIHGIVTTVNRYLKDADSCTPVGAAKKLHELLAESGVISEADEVFYNFEGQYKVKFEENGRPQVAVFWSPWQGGVSWRIEDDA
jgi:hypothetical protein